MPQTRLLSFLAIVSVSASLVAACSRGKKPVRVEQLEGESAVLPRVKRSAPMAATAMTRPSMRTIDVGDRTRKYLFVEPTSPPDPPSKKLPLVLVFHGDGGDAAGFHTGYPFEHASGAEAYLAYPDGLGSTWDLETTKDNRDESFIVALVESLAATYPIDRTRLFATGYSSGGFMANVLACHRPDMFRAIASNAGGAPYKQLEKWSNGYPKCPGQKPIAMLALHGEQDFGVTLDSGRFSAEYWAYVNGCKTDEMETTGYAECRVYRGCPAGKAVGFCSIPPLGHWVWAEAAEASWTFFERMSAN